MPDAALINIAMSMGRLPGELMAALEDEPEYWCTRFWIYTAAGGR